MAGMKPSFVTGANAKIKAGGLTLAYAQDVSYNVTIDIVPVETMGRYEVVSNEPVDYRVEGSLRVVRYTKVAQLNGMKGAAAGGNGVGKWNFTGTNPSTAAEHVNPGELLGSQTWDLEVFQKTPATTTAPGGGSVLVTKVMDCRFRSKGGGMDKRGILVESFAFVGVMMEDDSFSVSGSGDTDLA